MLCKLFLEHGINTFLGSSSARRCKQAITRHKRLTYCDVLEFSQRDCKLKLREVVFLCTIIRKFEVDERCYNFEQSLNLKYLLIMNMLTLVEIGKRRTSERMHDQMGWKIDYNIQIDQWENMWLKLTVEMIKWIFLIKTISFWLTRKSWLH